MNCEAVDELLSDLIEGELAEKTRAGVEAHVSSCERCGPAYQQLKRTVRFVRAQSEVPLEAGTPGGVYKEFTALLMQGESERATELMGRAVLGWPLESEGERT
jgi:anti-sigma factor RsiW